MKFNKLFKLFNSGLDKCEVAALKISLLISAMDGDITKEELEEFDHQARACQMLAGDQRQRYYETIRSAGYLMLLARTAKPEMLIDAFLIEAESTLPVFADFTQEQLDKAIVGWKNMAAADGEYSDIERRAIEALERSLTMRNDIRMKAIAGSLMTNHGMAF